MSTHQTAAQLLEAGTAKVLSHSSIVWRARFELEAETLLRQYGSFTAEEVVQNIGYPDCHPNAIGAMMRAFAKANGLSLLCYERSAKNSRRRGVVIRWTDKGD